MEPFNYKQLDIASKYPQARALLAQMTLDEKISQMQMRDNHALPEDSEFEAGHVGAILGYLGAEEANRLQRLAVEKSRLGIPLIIGDDVIHGCRTVFPIPLSAASTFDRDAVEEAESIAATEAAEDGFNLVFAPMVDLCREPRWGRIAEGSGEDSYLGGEMARAKVRGLQAVNPETGYPNVGACFKHFCGYGLSIGGRDYEECDIGERAFFGDYLKPYEAAVDEGAVCAMSSFNTLNGEAVSGSRYYLTDVLRRRLGFRGFVVSDWDAINELTLNHTAADKTEAARLASVAGCDMEMNSDVYRTALRGLAESEPEVAAAIDEDVTRILAVKYALGLFENPYRGLEGRKKSECDEFRAAARRNAAEGVVLLKNDNSILPLENGKKYFLTGPLADAVGDNVGAWGCRPDHEHIVNVRRAFGQRDCQTVYIKGCPLEKCDRTEFDAAKEAVRNCDIVIFVCGESGAWSGEARNLSSLRLRDIQNEYFSLLADEAAKAGKPLVTVLMTGRPLACTELAERSDALLLAWHAGVEAGHGVCDCLFGDYSPSGRLPVTFPKSVGQVPIYYNQRHCARPYDRERNSFRRYMDDLDGAPLYPFGYGLSYGKPVYNGAKLEKDALTVNDTLRVTVSVGNEADTPTHEVVQIYYEDMASLTAAPKLRQLCEFRRVFLPAHAKLEVSFDIPCSRFYTITRDGREIVEAGEFRLYTGHDSTCTEHLSFRIISE